MRRTISSLLILLLLPLSSSVGAQDGVLQRVREEVHTDRPAEPSREDSAREQPCSTDEDWDAWKGKLFLAVLLAPFVAPHEALKDDLRIEGRYLLFPYANERPGYLWIQRAEKPANEEFKNFLLRFSLDESNNFHGLNRVNGRLLFDTSSRFGIETGWTHLHERLSGGRTDAMVMGDVNLLFRFAQSERAQFRAGLGTRLLTDRGHTDFGFNFTYGADFFPVKPLVVSAVIDLGTLGSAGVFHGRLTGGITHWGWEIFAGYDGIRIGRATMQGPVVGIRYWF